MSTVSRDEIQSLAKLARLRLRDDEVERLQGDLSAILEHMDALAELDTSGVEAMTHAMAMGQRLRSGAVEASLPQDDALAGAPDCEDGSFVVPAILPSGDGQ